MKSPSKRETDSAMYLINKEIQSYIRCIKSLWDEYYRPLPDGEHDFTDVQQLVWKTLVSKVLSDTFDDISDGEIVIKPKGTARRALVGIASLGERSVSWAETSKSFENQLLLFADFFDFRDWKDPREFQYIECWSADQREHILFPTDQVDFYYRARLSARLSDAD